MTVRRQADGGSRDSTVRAGSNGAVKLWRHVPFLPARIGELSREAGVSEIIAELLLRVSVDTADAARRFLDPRLSELGDPFELTDADRAAERLNQAIERRESVAIFGDYDVDGVTSTAFLVSILRWFGLDPSYVVPLRFGEGYGLSREAIDRALAAGVPQLFVALDCGTNSTDAVACLRGLGVDVVIVDHHKSKAGVPGDCVMVNPHVHGDDGGLQDLCAVGLVFKLVHGLVKKRRDSGDPRAHEIRLRDYLDLVAMGTVADLVPLVGENRILARHGLAALGRTERPGLRALMTVSGMDVSHVPRPVDVSFRLGPRINASGRLADASLAVELLLSDDPDFCHDAALRLDRFNRERQDIERMITGTAYETIEGSLRDSHGIVLFDGEWHSGVVGVVASRLTRHLHKPCIVLGREGPLAKGSGRSIPGINLVHALSKCSHLLESWGGHPMAVGVSLDPANVPLFQTAFDAAVRACEVEDLAQPSLDVAAWIPLEAAGEGILGDLDLLHPFGQMNPEPVFATRAVVFASRPDVFKEQHYRFQLHTMTGRRVHGVAWNMSDRLPPVGQPVDIAYQLAWNRFNGRSFAQIQLLDWRLAQQV